MNTLTKLALGLVGQLKLAPPSGDLHGGLPLPSPRTTGGAPLMDVLRRRHSSHEFLPDELPPQMLSDLLWAAFGINRLDSGGRTAPSALNAQEMDIYLALPEGLFLFDARRHELRPVVSQDVRRATGYQDFVDSAPLDLIFVADHSRMKLVPASKRSSYASVAAGAISQNIYLFCASGGLGTVARAWFDRSALASAMGLGPDQQILLTQTVGYPKPAVAVSA